MKPASTLYQPPSGPDAAKLSPSLAVATEGAKNCGRLRTAVDWTRTVIVAANAADAPSAAAASTRRKAVFLIVSFLRERPGAVPIGGRRLGAKVTAAGGVLVRRMIGPVRGGQGGEGGLGLLEAARAVQLERGLEGARFFQQLLVGLPGKADQFVDADRLVLALDHDEVELARLDRRAGGFARHLRDQDVAAVGLVGALEPRGEVHAVAERR